MISSPPLPPTTMTHIIPVPPVGISLHVEQLSTSAPQHQLRKHIPKDAKAIFSSLDQYESIEEYCITESSSENMILINQSKLREQSAKSSPINRDNKVTSETQTEVMSHWISKEFTDLSLQFLDTLLSDTSNSNLLDDRFDALLALPGESFGSSIRNVGKSLKQLSLVDELLAPQSYVIPHDISSMNIGSTSNDSTLLMPSSSSMQNGFKLQDRKPEAPKPMSTVAQIASAFDRKSVISTSAAASDSTKLKTEDEMLSNAAASDIELVSSMLETMQIASDDLDVELNDSDYNISSPTSNDLTPNEVTSLTPSIPDVASITHVDVADPVPVSSRLEDGDDFERSLSELLADNNGFKHPISTKNTSSTANRNLFASEETLPLSEFDALRPNLALQYPFELDFFQKQAVLRLERSEFVFVAAHTSAGKTVVAEYAIALAQKHMTRAIYTSPIKALSNQKFRDLRERFGESAVGLMTGDSNVNPSATCLVMTTEILRSMLYRGADIVRDIEYVIFDEVHYVNDAERGVVWEEVIIMLPETVQMVFLSATTPNKLEFSSWIGRTKRRMVYVTGTNQRPVPLQHFLYYNDEVFPLMKADCRFRSGVIGEVNARQKERDRPKEASADNAKMAMQRRDEKNAVASQQAGRSIQLKPYQGASKGGSSGGSNSKFGPPSGSKKQWTNLANILQLGGREQAGGLKEIDFGLGYNSKLLSAAARKEKVAKMVPFDKLPADIRNQLSRKEYEKESVRASELEDEADESSGLQPTIVFCFSKKKCEEIADFLKGQSLLSSQEKSEVHKVMKSAISRLSSQDSQLPQVGRISEMLSRGIGVHHGGLLPILKECVEILFSQSLVRILIATETFAMGVNMPARSVVYNGFRKHDGKDFRNLLPGEYTQMAGRAGRRGKDKVGTVIIAAWSDIPDEPQLQQLLTGQPTKLASQFRLTYSMILNLLRSGDLSVEEMIKRSFSEFHTQRALSGLNISQQLVKWKSVSNQLHSQLATTQCNHGLCPIDDCVNFFITVQRIQASLLIDLGDNVTNLLCPGRAVVYFPAINTTYSIPSPCRAIVLSEPFLPPDTTSGVKSVSSSGARQIWLLVLLPVGVDLPSPNTKISTVPVTSAPVTRNVSEIALPPSGMTVLKRKDDYGPMKPSAKVASTVVLWQETSSSTCKFNGKNRNYFIIKATVADITLVSGFKFKPPTATTTTALIPVLTDLDQANVEGEVVDLLRESKARSLSFETASKQSSMTAFAEAYAISLCHKCPSFSSRFAVSHKVFIIKEKILFWEQKLSNTNLALFPDFKQKLSLLHLLGYIQQESSGQVQGSTVTVKGRVACEMNTCDELLATEIIFDNILEPLNPPEAAALLSALIFEEKSDNDQQLTSRLEVACAQCVQIQHALGYLSDAHGLPASSFSGDERGKGGLNFGLAAVVYQWARGVPFSEITNMTSVQEGSIVRTITRLDELCRDFRNASRVVGNPHLYRKMEAASQCIRRDIVFAGSLYIT